MLQEHKQIGSGTLNSAPFVRKGNNMHVPKYIQEIMSRSKYEYDFLNDENASVGYTIRILKYSEYQKASTFLAEIQRLKKWVDDEYKRIMHNEAEADVCYIISVPSETHYVKQYAIVTIFDPIMKHLEKYIPTEK